MLSTQFVEPMALCMLLVLLSLCLQLVPNAMRQHRLARAMGCRSAKSKASLKDPYIGIDFIYNHLFKRAPATYMDQANRIFLQLGPTYISKRWTWETVYTCDHRNIKQILATGFDDFELPWVRVGAMSSLLGQGIFTLNGKSWSHARSILKPSLTKSNMGHLNEMIEKHFQAFIQLLPTDNSQVDLQPLFFGLAMDIATDFLMNHSTQMLDPSKRHELEERFIDDYMVCSENVSQRMQMGPLQIFAFSTKASQARKRVFKYMDDYIEDCLQRKKEGDGSERYDVLQELTKATRSRETLRDQMLHILLASRDTTASLLSNLFFLLGNSPVVYAKLREDVLNTAGSEPPTAEQLKEMRYLKWCVQESLRLHPPIPTNARGALKDTTLPRGGGVNGLSPLFLKKGTIVVYNVYSVHRDEAVYGSDAEDFRPERWEGLRPGWAYLPFNGGPRICLGQHFALQEAHYIVARFVQTFKSMKSHDDRPWLELYALAMTCKNGVQCSLEKP